MLTEASQYILENWPVLGLLIVLLGVVAGAVRKLDCIDAKLRGIWSVAMQHEWGIEMRLNNPTMKVPSVDDIQQRIHARTKGSVLFDK